MNLFSFDDHQDDLYSYNGRFSGRQQWTGIVFGRFSGYLCVAIFGRTACGALSACSSVVTTSWGADLVETLVETLQCVPIHSLVRFGRAKNSMPIQSPSAIEGS